MTETISTVRKNDWIRFQIPDKRVLEGYVQQISDDGSRILVGKAPDNWPENEWYALANIKIIKTQELYSPA